MVTGHFRTESFELAENTGESACDGVVDFTGQRRCRPGRVSGTQLKNPDFAAMADAFGGCGVRVTENSQIPAAIQSAYQAIETGKFALIHLIVEQRKQAY